MITDEELRDYFRATTHVDEQARDRVLAAVSTAGAPAAPRRKVAVLAGVGIAGAVAATAVVAGLAGGHASSTSPGATAPPTSSATSEPGPKATPSPSRAVLNRMTPAQIANTFETLLPDGWHVVSSNAADLGAAETWVNAVIDDGQGPALVSVTLTYPPQFDYESAPVGCQDDPSLSWPASACAAGPVGSQVLAVKTYEYPEDPSRGAKEWIVEAWQPWPFAVRIHEWNAPTEKDTAATRDDPPLTLDELRKIALSPDWTS
jgi:hypothetical protein